MDIPAPIMVTFTADIEMYKKIAEIMKRDNVNRSEAVRILIRKGIEVEEHKTAA